MKTIIPLLGIVLFYLISTEVKAQTVYGRVYIDNQPMIVGKVIVFYDHWTKDRKLDYSKKIKETPVNNGKGPQAGTYEIAGLPANVDLMIVAIHPKIPNQPGISKIKLKSNERRKVILDISLGKFITIN